MNNSKQMSQIQEKEFIQTHIRADELEKRCQEGKKTKSIEMYEPLPLERSMPPAKSYPFDALGDIAGVAARRIHEVVQAPDATCGQSVLAALSLACQPFIDVQIDGRTYPTSLFMLTISESGERKSATDKVALKPIYDWQMMLVQQQKKQLVEYKNKFEVWKRKRDIVIKNASESSDLELQNIEKEPLAPCEGIILCDEPTLEGLEQLLERGQPSIGIFSDEGGRLVGGHAMNADNALKTACGLSNLWDGKALTKVRKGEGSKIHFGRRLAMHLMIQPIVLLQLTKNQLLMGQGLLSRCLFSAPAALAGTRKYKEVDLNKDPSILNFHNLLNSMLDKPYPKEVDCQENATTFGPGDTLKPTPLVLEGEVKKRWIELHDDNDSKIAENGIFYSIKPFASKAPEQVLRIAAIFAYSECDKLFRDKIQIDLKHLERAILLVDYYLHEALRILGQGEINQNISLAMKTLEWIKKTYQTDQLFTLSEVYQYGPSQVRNADKAKEIMKIIEAHDQVISMPNVIINNKKVRFAWKLVNENKKDICMKIS